MTSKELYNYILDQNLSYETSICRLHTRCETTDMCGKANQTVVLDFDKLETNYHQKGKVPSSASVDALTYINNQLLFIELKSLKLFLQHTSTKLNSKNIQKQVNRFDLRKKLLDSVMICSDLAQDSAFLADKSPIYVIVTDINTAVNGLASFAERMNVLANTSSDWEQVCNQFMIEKIQGISEMKTRYLYCEEFDKFIRSLGGEGTPTSTSI